MKPFKLAFFIVFLLFSAESHSQSQFRDIDPKWENYYKANPSNITTNHQAADFIRIIRLVKFVPISRDFNGSSDLLETALLGLSQAGLRQMMIDGLYFSRTFKHDDYFILYNKFYNSITKDTWDKYCPYLIPLMSIDRIISTKP